MKRSLTVLLLTSFLFPVYGAHQKKVSRTALIPKKEYKPLTGYWRRIHATDEEKQESQAVLKEHADEYQAFKQDKQNYRDKLDLAAEIDKKQFLESKKSIYLQGFKNNDEPYTFMAQFDSSYYHGINLELLNGRNQSDYASFMQYTFDTGIYIHPHTHNLENETVEFKAMARMKGVAGNTGRYFQTDPKRTKIGWAIAEQENTHSTNRFSLWMRELWLKFYFNKDKKGYIVTGLFPYSLGHGIALGNGYSQLVGQPMPGHYSLYYVDQFKPGILISNTFNDDQALWDLYLGFGDNFKNTFKGTAEHSDAQNLDQTLNVSRGTDKKHYIVAGQIKAQPKLQNPDTDCLINPYFVLNYDNTQKVEFEHDAKSRLFTFGGCFEWQNGPLNISIEGAQNLGKQKVKHWDRNEHTLGAVTFNSHILWVDPNIVPIGNYPISLTDTPHLAEDQFTNAIGIPPSQGNEVALPPGTPDPAPDATYSQQFANGELFAVFPPTGLTPKPLVYKNSFSRFRNAYENSYRGWFIMGDIGYQFNKWRVGSSAGIFSGDDNPNDSSDYILATRRKITDSSGVAFAYKDYDKKYKGFVGTHEMFKSKSITPCFIHEAQKLNCPLVKCNSITTPQLTNLLFLGFGLKRHTVYNHKECLSNFNLVFYSQKKSGSKGVNQPYTDFVNLNHSDAQQADAAKKLDTYLGFELNASTHYKLTYDLDLSGKIAIFVPGKHYSTAEGKHLPFDKQLGLIGPQNTGVFTIGEQFNTTTLGKDTALFATVSLVYSFDSIFLKNTQKAYKSHKTLKTKEL
jgi:hypothetical protein